MSLEPAMNVFITVVVSAMLNSALPAAPAAAGDGWIVLSDDLKAFQPPTGKWYIAGGARMNPKFERRLVGEPGRGTLINGKIGVTDNLITRQQWGDVEVSLEFMIPRGSNSGVKLHGVYEIQIFDSWKVAKPTGEDCGGIYPRAELKPFYHHIDEGIAPRVNAAKAPGQWQTLDDPLPRSAFRPAGTQDCQCPIREGGAQRQADPRQRRGGPSDGQRLAGPGACRRAAAVPGRSWPGGFPQHSRAAAAGSCRRRRNTSCRRRISISTGRLAPTALGLRGSA